MKQIYYDTNISQAEEYLKQFPPWLLEEEPRKRLQRLATWFASPVSEAQNPPNETLQARERPPAKRPVNDNDQNERCVKS